MKRVPRHEAEALAERVYASLRPSIVKAVCDLLSDPEESDAGAEDLSPQDIARVERTAATWRRRVAAGEKPARGPRAG